MSDAMIRWKELNVIHVHLVSLGMDGLAHHRMVVKVIPVQQVRIHCVQSFFLKKVKTCRPAKSFL